MSRPSPRTSPASGGSSKLIDISDEEARDDLARLSATMISVVAQSARLADGETTAVDPELVASGATAATRFLLEWRGEADPKHVRAIDTYWICTAEHGLNASTFAARVVASTGADCARRRSRRPSARSRARCTAARRRASCRCSTRARRPTRSTEYVSDLLDSGGRLMGFGHRVYRAEDPRSRLLRGTAMDLGSPRFDVAEELERVALAELHRRKPDRVLATNVEFWSAVVLDVAEVPPQLAPAMFACSRTAGWSAHILEQKRLGRLVRPSAELRRPRPALARGAADGPRQAAALADQYAKGGLERELATLRGEWADEIEASARHADYRVRAQAYRPIAQFHFRQKLELLRRGLEDESPAVRGSALIALEGCRARIRVTSTRTARCSTSSPPATRTSPCAGSPSSASRTARPRARRS